MENQSLSGINPLVSSELRKTLLGDVPLLEELAILPPPSILSVERVFTSGEED